MDTIFALSSARGKSGVAVIRLSGPEAGATLVRLSGDLPVPRKAALRILSDNDEVLDQALVLWLPGPESFTGEDVVEFHVHGAIATVNVVLRVLGDQAGLRLAEPGEFTRRALENERLDLAQVEGLSDLVEAETEAQRKQALRVLSGALGDRAGGWRVRLIRAAALLEATIDFADEEVPMDVMPEVRVLMQGVSSELAIEARGVQAAERIRDGFEVAIVGAPNVGKSTLLNALAGREAAITSNIAGTTRDVIEVRMDLRGLPVTILDTAGMREATDQIEALGIDLARARADASDLRVVLKATVDEAPVVDVRDDDIVVISKADLGIGDVSAKTGVGLDALVVDIADRLENRAASAGIAIRERHRVAMLRAIDALGIAMDRLDSSPELAEFVAEDLRTAIRALDSLVGRVDVEHVLGEIFASFCIGK
ncbi:tRNA uridine-5-carboxymethylaminomethyl(34) synthesis GTPase MnmE [Rhodobacteraceae bacterium]|nr:tRNA uridine-5-carboxymethylaminomethyl(34) synthesis GTPase MnmE [Paracoccaceae bacterium]